MPATTNDSATAGPAFSPAASPVSTKMPVPMTTPTPKTVRSRADSSLAQLVLGLLGVRDRLLDGLVRKRFIWLHRPGGFDGDPAAAMPAR